MFRQYSFLTLGLTVTAILFSFVRCASSSECVRISAATSSYPYMFFIIGDEVLEVEGHRLNYRFPASEYGLDQPITAAFMLEEQNQFYVLTAKGQEAFYGLPIRHVADQLNDFSEIERKFKGDKNFDGIDAAVMGPNNLVHYFAGCHYVTMDPSNPADVSNPMPNSGVGLPCDVDAALVIPKLHDSVPVVIKGNRAWVYNGFNGRYFGPIPVDVISSTLRKVNLCSSGE